MSWYTVTKTIKGRRYLYLQMTYRVGKQVKTKNKYLGPASSKGASFGFGAPSNLPIAETKTPKPRTRRYARPAPIKRARVGTKAYKKYLAKSIRRRNDEWKRAKRNYEKSMMTKEEWKRRLSIEKFLRIRKRENREAAKLAKLQPKRWWVHF